MKKKTKKKKSKKPLKAGSWRSGWAIIQEDRLGDEIEGFYAGRGNWAENVSQALIWQSKIKAQAALWRVEQWEGSSGLELVWVSGRYPRG